MLGVAWSEHCKETPTIGISIRVTETLILQFDKKIHAFNYWQKWIQVKRVDWKKTVWWINHVPSLITVLWARYYAQEHTKAKINQSIEQPFNHSIIIVSIVQLFNKINLSIYSLKITINNQKSLNHSTNYQNNQSIDRLIEIEQLIYQSINKSLINPLTNQLVAS